MLLLPTEKIEQYDSVELTDLNGNTFQLNLLGNLTDPGSSQPGVYKAMNFKIKIIRV